MNKTEYRKSMRSKLKLISERRKEDTSLSLLNTFKNFKNKNILSFASMKTEVNLWPLNQKLLASNNLFLPKVSEKILKIYKVKNISSLKKSQFGILEPDSVLCEEADLNEIDIVLVPGLAFDKENNRLGYGRGFYDRLLYKFKGEKIGICFKEQLHMSIPVESHDQKIDQLLSF